MSTERRVQPVWTVFFEDFIVRWAQGGGGVFMLNGRVVQCCKRVVLCACVI